jgi:hypothetical protein
VIQLRLQHPLIHMLLAYWRGLLDALSNDLVGVVRETMQPAHVSLKIQRAVVEFLTNAVYYTAKWLKSSSTTFGEQAFKDAISCAKRHPTSTQMDVEQEKGRWLIGTCTHSGDGHPNHFAGRDTRGSGDSSGTQSGAK